MQRRTQREKGKEKKRRDETERNDRSPLRIKEGKRGKEEKERGHCDGEKRR